MPTINSEPIAISKAAIAVIAANKGRVIVGGPCDGLVLVTFAGRLIDGLYHGVLCARQPTGDETGTVDYSDIVASAPNDYDDDVVEPEIINPNYEDEQ